MDNIKEWLSGLWTQEEGAVLGVKIVVFAGVLVIAYLSHALAKKLFLRAIKHFVERSKTTWDDIFFERNLFTRICHIVPALIIYVLTPLVLEGYPSAVSAIQALTEVYMVLIGLLVLDAFLNGIIDVYRTYSLFQKMPIRGFVQVIKIILYILAFVVVLSILLGKSPFIFLGGMGAMTAVLMLIFKDSILGLVAGVQLAMNDMVRIGDWIEMPKYGADGDVIDIALTTVKVQNWDKTISTIPSHALVSDSFKNWRGMSESGGRRIKRAVYIDMSSVKFCTDEMIAKFKKIQFLRNYIESKEKELNEYNAAHGIDNSVLVNGRRMTNLGTFRAYIAAYLRNHPMVKQDMTLMVRHLDLTSHGLPVQVYVFCKDQRWVSYEAIQADIFDHILAVVPEFELRVFQSPSGEDVKALAYIAHSGPASS